MIVVPIHVTNRGQVTDNAARSSKRSRVKFIRKLINRKEYGQLHSHTDDIISSVSKTSRV